MLTRKTLILRMKTQSYSTVVCLKSVVFRPQDPVFFGMIRIQKKLEKKNLTKILSNRMLNNDENILVVSE